MSLLKIKIRLHIIDIIKGKSILMFNSLVHLKKKKYQT